MTLKETGTLQQNFDSLRVAVEDCRYQDVESLLVEQRTLVKGLPFADPEARAMLQQAGELTMWSLAMVRIQRAGMERDLARFAQLRNLEGYKPVPAER